ncbi:archease [Desulfuromonas sp. KJ2020]|uniref:archease n=1 Tax=Desulfuromonas sp. KJ2020 TaxID=2919173 RepID=UPI0020A792EC|nr:archease [Desulfuromonas sp. KJ2020]MCP3176020.1 archease [Desulfuromonas sp. KJ2020]
MSSYRLLEHTADMGIEATAATLEDLYAQAAKGLIAIIFGNTSGPALRDRFIELDGSDLADLLVRWLNEILYLVEMEHFLPCQFTLDPIQNHHLRGKVRGFHFDEERVQAEREVKAVTYHQLEVRRQAAGWLARVYVDL